MGLGFGVVAMAMLVLVVVVMMGRSTKLLSKVKCMRVFPPGYLHTKKYILRQGAYQCVCPPTHSSSGANGLVLVVVVMMGGRHQGSSPGTRIFYGASPVPILHL
eukprot:7820108-Karenia_brevis.AAC.1